MRARQRRPPSPVGVAPSVGQLKELVAGGYPASLLSDPLLERHRCFDCGVEVIRISPGSVRPASYLCFDCYGNRSRRQRTIALNLDEQLEAASEHLRGSS